MLERFGVFENNYSVKGIFVLCILAEIARADELEAVAVFGICHGRLEISLYMLYGFGIKVVIILGGGYLGHIRFGKQLIVESNVRFDSVGCGKPMDSTLYFSAVGRHTAARFKVGSTKHLGNNAVFVCKDILALNDISAHKTNLAALLHTEVLGRRIERNVITVDIKMLCKGNVTSARFGIGGVVGQREVFLLVFGIICNGYLYGVKHRNAAESSLVKLFTDAMLKQIVIHDAVGAGNACAGNEIY